MVTRDLNMFIYDVKGIPDHWNSIFDFTVRVYCRRMVKKEGS